MISYSLLHVSYCESDSCSPCIVLCTIVASLPVQTNFISCLCFDRLQLSLYVRSNKHVSICSINVDNIVPDFIMEVYFELLLKKERVLSPQPPVQETEMIPQRHEDRGYGENL